MKMVLVDTSAWLAVAVRKDQHHILARECYMSLLNERAILLTSDYILDETLTRIRYDAGHGKAVEFLDILNESVCKGFLAIKRIDEKLWEEAAVLFRRYDKPKLSFTDCTSFSLARRCSVSSVFAFDEDFRMMGFEVIP